MTKSFWRTFRLVAALILILVLAGCAEKKTPALNTQPEVTQTSKVQMAEDSAKSGTPIDEQLPTPSEFVAFEEAPVHLYAPAPKYPEMARKSGIEGSVWVKVLVDTSGNVKDAVILKESGANAGFEESALEAAKQSKWKPAMHNKQPVAVWVSYEIKFRLKR